jgi:colanic acid biosynthesis glycosyl transferase WcaI
MHIVLVTNYHPPEIGSNSHLYHALACDLAARRRSVTVVTGQPRYHAGAAAPADAPGVAVLRARVPEFGRPGAFWSRVLNELLLPFALLRQVARCRPAGVLCIYSPPLSLGLLGFLAKLLWGVPFVFHVQDLLPQAAIDMGALRNPVAIALLRYVEGWIYRRAAAVLVHSEGNRESILRSHPRLGTPVASVYNWVDFDALRPPFDPLPPDLERFLEGRKIFSYGGALGLQHDISTILAAAERLRAHRDIGFVIAGSGSREAHWREVVSSRGLDNVRIVPLMPQRQFYGLLARSRASFLALSPLLKTPVVPGKLQAIMAAGVPALCTLNPASDAVRIVREAGCGRAVAPGEVNALAAYIALLANDEAQAARLGEAGRRFALAHFSKDVSIAAIERELAAAANRAARPAAWAATAGGRA